MTDRLLDSLGAVPSADPFVGPDQVALEELLAGMGSVGAPVTSARGRSSIRRRHPSRNTRRRIFPEVDLGISSTNVTVRTCL